MRRCLDKPAVFWTGLIPAVILGVQAFGAQPLPSLQEGGTANQQEASPRDPRLAAASTAETSLAVDELIHQLGAPRFAVRQQAAEQIQAIGLAARKELVRALTHADAEIRRRAGACLNAILDHDRSRRLQLAVADPALLDEMNLPGWRRFQATIGSDHASRRFYLEMFQAEPRLMESGSAGGMAARESLTARCRQISLFRQLATDHSQREARFASVAAMMFIACEPTAELPPPLLMDIMAHANKAEFQFRLDGDDSAPVRRLLANWIHFTADSPVTYQSLLLAARFDVKQALPPAKRLAEAETASAEARMYAILLVGKVGNASDAAWMTRFLDDQSVCAAYAYLRDGSRGRYETQIRDVALATLVKFTGQSHAEYGFNRLRTHSQMLFNTSSIGFAAGQDDRQQALARWRQWSEEHSLNEHPLVAPPRMLSYNGDPKLDEESQSPAEEKGSAIRVAQTGPNNVGPLPEGWGREANIANHERPDDGENDAAGNDAMVAPHRRDDPDVTHTTGAAVTPSFYLTDRQVRFWLGRAEDCIVAEQYREASQFVNEALNSPLANSFQPDRIVPIHVGIRAEAERLLGRFPAAGLTVYELNYGDAAERELRAAVANRNPLAIADVARRYFYTRAGATAQLLWGAHLYDAQQPMAAAAAYSRLMTHPLSRELGADLPFRLAAALAMAGYPEEADAIIGSMNPPPRGKFYSLGKQRFMPSPRKPFEPEELSRWLQESLGTAHGRSSRADWPVFGGDSTRNRIVSGEHPLLRARWSVETISQPKIQGAVAELSAAYAAQRRAAVPGAHPIAVGGVLVARTPSGLLAIDTQDGAQIWKSEFDPQLESRLIDELNDDQRHLLFRELDERMWGDAASGRLTSDGHRVFAIDNAGQVGDALSQKMIIAPGGNRRLEPRWPSDRNRLVAFDLASEGKTVWTLGGPEGEYELPLAGTYFLGPPLPLGGQLYVLAERQDLIQLLILDAESGAMRRAITLVSLDGSDGQFGGSYDKSLKAAVRHAQRRCGAMPVYQDGILVCPTSDGGFAAVDVAQTEVIWTYRATPRYMREVFTIWKPANDPSPPPDPRAPRMLDGDVLIAGDSVLIAPLETSTLLCLDLKTGGIRWERPQDDLLYVATATRGVVVLAGRSGLRGVDLATGRSCWPELLLPPGSAPSGRGFASGETYYLPLTTAELAVISIPNGRLVSRLKSHDNRAPGNLICAQDYVVSQQVDRLEIFEQLSFALASAEAEATCANPTAESLTRYGEVLMFSGNYAAACEQLKAAYALKQDQNTLELLCHALVEALTLDYARFEPLAQRMIDVEAGLISEQTRREFIRLQAEHARESGDVVKAFDAVMQLVQLSADSAELVARRPTLDVAHAAWLRGQMRAIRSMATTPELQNELDRRIGEIYDHLPDDALAYGQFAELFPDHPFAAAAKWKLFEEFPIGNPLKRQWLLLDLLQADKDATRRDAMSRLFWLLVDHSRLTDAASISRMWDREFGEPEQDDLHKVVRAVIDADKPLWEPADSEIPAWPEHAERREPSELRAAYGRRYPLRLEEIRDAEPSELRLQVRSDAQAIFADNVYGVRRWMADLQVDGKPLAPMNAEAMRAKQVGQLLVVWRGHDVYGIDLMSPPDAPPRILWRKSLATNFPGRKAENSVVVRAAARAGESPRLTAFDNSGIPLGILGPVNRKVVVYQRGHTLEAIHPLTGDVLWRRHDIAPGSQLLGDERHVIFVEPDCRMAVVLHADDGREAGRCLAPPAESWVTTSGRRIVAWNDESPARLVIVDPIEGLELDERRFAKAATIYQGDFAPGAEVWRIGNQHVAVCDPTGTLVIVRCSDGSVIVNERIGPQPEMTDLYALRSKDRFIAVVSGPTTAADSIFAVPGGYDCPLVNGTAYGFDAKTGEFKWEAPVENQSLELDQPEFLPVLTFACRQLSPQGEAGQSRRYSSRVLCLDKRNGDVLIQDERDGSINRVEIAADFNKWIIEIRTTQNAYKLRFWDDDNGQRP